MFLCRDKKGMVLSTIVNIVIITIALFLIIGIINHFFSKAEGATADSICRGSVLAREKYALRYLGGTIKKSGPPLLCKTEDKIMPEKEGGSKEEIKRDISNLITKTWYMFGEGLPKNIFDDFIFGGYSCFVKYTISVKSNSKFKYGDYISREDLLSWLSLNPYKVEVKETKNKRYACEKKGGVCVEGGLCSSDKMYYSDPAWSCGRNQICCVDKKNFITYIDYIQSYVGEGRLFITNEKFEPGETYGIALVSPHAKWFKVLVGDFNPNANYIIINKLNDLSKYCVKVEDIAGK